MGIPLELSMDPGSMRLAIHPTSKATCRKDACTDPTVKDLVYTTVRLYMYRKSLSGCSLDKMAFNLASFCCTITGGMHYIRHTVIAEFSHTQTIIRGGMHSTLNLSHILLPCIQ